jgi:carbamoyl-phosphate synthase small subunit
VLRDNGPLNGSLFSGAALLTANESEVVASAKSFPGLQGMDLAKEVSNQAGYIWQEGVWDIQKGYLPAPKIKFHVVAYDFGVKRNILRMLVARGCRVTVVPAATTSAEVLGMKPDGVFLSNGPGDPKPCDYAIQAIADLLEENVPLFGICLGYQLLALACGARTIKMQLGHHGANHPVENLKDGTVLITSQNHGFAVEESSLPSNVEVTHKSLFDGSLQGIERLDKPAFGFQGHPEASPGPHDVSPLFDKFIKLLEEKTI